MNAFEMATNCRIKITHIHRSCYCLSSHICPFCFSPNRPCMLSMCRCYRWHIQLGMRGTLSFSYHRNNHRDSCWDIYPRAKIDLAYKGCTAIPTSRCRRSTMNGNRHSCDWECKWHFNYSGNWQSVLERKFKTSFRLKWWHEGTQSHQFRQHHVIDISNLKSEDLKRDKLPIMHEGALHILLVSRSLFLLAAKLHSCGFGRQSFINVRLPGGIKTL